MPLEMIQSQRCSVVTPVMESVLYAFQGPASGNMPHLHMLLDVCGAAADIAQPLLMRQEEVQSADAQDNCHTVAEKERWPIGCFLAPSDGSGCLLCCR